MTFPTLAFIEQTMKLVGWGIQKNTTICMYVKELYIKDTFTFKKAMKDQCEELLDLEQPFSPWLACIMVVWCIKM